MANKTGPRALEPEPKEGDSAADARERNDRYYARNIRELAEKLNTWLVSARESGLTVDARVDELRLMPTVGVRPLPPIPQIAVELSRPVTYEGQQ